MGKQTQNPLCVWRETWELLVFQVTVYAVVDVTMNTVRTSEWGTMVLNDEHMQALTIVIRYKSTDALRVVRRKWMQEAAVVLIT